MVSHIRKHLSNKICDVLKQHSIIRATNDDRLVSKFNYFTKVATVTKASKNFATFVVNFNDLHDNQVITQNNFSQDIKQKLENLSDDIIKSSTFNNSKLIIETDLEQFSKNTILSIFNQLESYGFFIDDENSIYPKKIDNNLVKWMPKKPKRKTIVEFSSPNIAKPLHAGHMRSTFLGMFISNSHEALEDEVTRINYLGDWGTQYGILAIGFQKYGSMEKLESTPMRHLLEVYIKANKDESIYNDALAYFNKMESGDAEAIKIWNLFRDMSIKELIETYKKLNIKFDIYDAESLHYRQSKEIVKMLVEKNICRKLDDNALQVEFDYKYKNESKKSKYIVQKKDGSTLYITRDLAALLERKAKYNFSKIVYVVDSSQTDHFRNLYQTIKILDPKCLEDLEFEEFYVPFGRFTNMSTRSGRVEFLSDLINEAKEVALEYMNKAKVKKEVEDRETVAQVIGTSHLLINDFMKPRIKDYKFTWTNILSNDDSSYMIHYAHARLYSLLERAKTEMNINIDPKDIDFKLFKKPIELILIQHLAKYHEIVWQSSSTYEPYILVQYLFQLVRFVNLSLTENYVIGEEKNIAKARLILYFCCKQVISNSLRLLGIKPLNRI